MKFADLNHADAWRRISHPLLQALSAEMAAIEAVVYTEEWLCGHSPSFVAGFDDGDSMIVCVPLSQRDQVTSERNRAALT